MVEPDRDSEGAMSEGRRRFTHIGGRVTGWVEQRELLSFAENADLQVWVGNRLVAEGPVYDFPVGFGLSRLPEQGKVEPFLADPSELVAIIIARKPMTSLEFQVVAQGLGATAWVTIPGAKLEVGGRVSSSEYPVIEPTA
jgi:hypothetical protein